MGQLTIFVSYVHLNFDFALSDETLIFGVSCKKNI